jgi:hypothetical protein
VIGIIVVTICALIGLAVGALSGALDGDSDAEGTGGGAQSGQDSDTADTAGTGGQEADTGPEDTAGAGDTEGVQVPDEGALAAAQATALSALLEESGTSRSTVISSVVSIQSCGKLQPAAQELRNAATQRNDLVIRLDELTLDALPQHQELTTALRQAWQSSAQADEFFAAWADDLRADKRKLCKDAGGSAPATANSGEANRVSLEATAAKERAAELWNPIARQHGLPERQPIDL